MFLWSRFVSAQLSPSIGTTVRMRGWKKKDERMKKKKPSFFFLAWELKVDFYFLNFVTFAWGLA